MAQELFTEFKGSIENMNLISSGGGRFEVEVDGTLIYSKLSTGRHAEEGEVTDLFAKQTDLVPASAAA